MFQGNGVYELPNGNHLHQTTAINYAVEINGGSLTTNTGDYTNLAIAVPKDEALGMARALGVKTVYNYSQDNGNNSFERPTMMALLPRIMEQALTHIHTKACRWKRLLMDSTLAI